MSSRRLKLALWIVLPVVTFVGMAYCAVRMLERLGVGIETRVTRVEYEYEDWRPSPLPQLHAIRLVVEADAYPIHEVALSPDGRRLAAAGDRGVVWDLESGRALLRMNRQIDRVGVGFSADGTRVVASGCPEGTVVWPLETDGVPEVAGWEAWRGVATARTSPDGGRLVIPDMGDRAWIVDLATGTTVARFEKADCSEGLDAAFSPDGRWIASGGRDNRAHLWDAATGRLVRSFVGHRSPPEWSSCVTDVAFFPDGRRLVTGGEDGTARVWDVESSTATRVLRGHEGAVMDVAVSVGGETIATADHGGTVRLWSAGTGTLTRRLDGHRDAVLHVSFHPDGKHLISTGVDGTIRLWSLEEGTETTSLAARVSRPLGVAFRPDGHPVVVLRSPDRGVGLWFPTRGPEVVPLDGHEGPVLGVTLADGAERVATSGEDGAVLVHDIEGGRTIARFQVGDPDREALFRGVSHIAISPDGRHVISGGPKTNTTATVWSVATGERVADLERHEYQAMDVGFEPNGRWVWTVDQVRTVRIWNLETHRRQRTIRGALPLSAASGDGRGILVATSPRRIEVRDAETGDLIRAYEADMWGPHALANSPDGRLLAAGDDCGRIAIWDTATAEVVVRASGHDGPVVALAFSPDGSRLLSCGEDRTIRIWRVDGGRELARLVHLRDGTQAVVDAAGRFEASKSGNLRGIHWVVDGRPVLLSDMRAEYESPGLLEWALGLGGAAPREVPALETLRDRPGEESR